MRVLISVSDKKGIVEFARSLTDQGAEIVSTGGTYRVLKEAGIEAKEVSGITGFPECLDGRVKTLHPMIHAGILAVRSNPDHMKQLKELHVTPIDMVVVNLYPFRETISKEGVTRAEAIENIDIGGPSMVRAAAKNYQDVTVVTDPADYPLILEELRNGPVSEQTKFRLMQKAFEHTASYDAMIADYLRRERGDHEMPQKLTMTFEKIQDMRYGENPHQQAAFYREITKHAGSLTDAEQLNGKELSFNNINDTNGALELLKEFDEPTVVCCKHGNPCGVGSAPSIGEAWEKAYSADRMSVFGGIVTVNRPVTEQIAAEMAEVFLEVIVAPDYEEKALEILCRKKNVRVLKLDQIGTPQDPSSYDLKKVNGGLIVQTIDSILLPEDGILRTVTKMAPSAAQLEDMMFAWKIVKYTKSNAIVCAKNKQSVGIGPGQVNRVWAAVQCFDHAKELIGEDASKGAVLASDAYLPFDDVVEAAHKAGIAAIIQPGGSMRDQLSIDKCDEYGIAMVYTGMRHFRH